MTEELMNEESVPLPPPSAPADIRTLRVALPLITLSWVILLSIMVMATFRIQRWELAPGEAMDVSSRIGFMPAQEGGVVPKRYVADNGIQFVTAFGGQLSILDSVLGWLDPYVQVDTYTEHFGEQTPTSSRRLGFQAMTGAKQVAEYVAMKKLGLDAKLEEGPILIEQLICEGAPAEDSACVNLQVGEQITHLDGVQTPTLSALAVEMKKHKVGDNVKLTVLPYSTPNNKTSKKPKVVTVALMTSPDDERAIIGFIPADTRITRLPFEVNISTTDIGGPSAGLAFTLALLDELTPGNLMGNGRVAATGTMDEEQNVGAIGALKQKAVAVRDSGGTLFLVPAGQSPDEMKAAQAAAGPGVRIVQVATPRYSKRLICNNKLPLSADFQGHLQKWSLSTDFQLAAYRIQAKLSNHDRR
jgi:PDZ domain-containing protein